MSALDGNINMFANNDMNLRVGGTLSVRAGKIIENSDSTTTRAASGSIIGSIIDYQSTIKTG